MLTVNEDPLGLKNRPLDPKVGDLRCTFGSMEILSCWALLASSFLAATVVPFSSEAVLAATLLGGGDPLICLAIATIGNTAGGMTGYLLGLWGHKAILSKHFNISSERLGRWTPQIQRYGSVAALACWLPGVGDVIAVALGALKTRILPTLIWMTLGKAARYAAIIGLMPH